MKRVVLILTSLLIVLAVLLFIVNRDRNLKDGIVIRQAETEQTISLKQISKLEMHSFSTVRGDNFSGYSLLDILDSQETSFQKYLVLFSVDGGSLRLNADEIQNSYLVLMDDTETPSLRLIIPTDEFGQRWMKYVKTIEVH
jgi:hypothetical protein